MASADDDHKTASSFVVVPPCRRGRLGSADLGKDSPMSAHIIGRPNDDLLDILLGDGADPEQAFIGGREQRI